MNRIARFLALSLFLAPLTASAFEEPILYPAGPQQGVFGRASLSADGVGTVCRVDSGGVTRCFARDAQGETLSCTSSDPGIREAAKAISPGAAVRFHVAPNESCASLEVTLGLSWGILDWPTFSDLCEMPSMRQALGIADICEMPSISGN